MSETTNEYERALPDEFLNAPVKFGLVAQGHIPTIDRMLAEGKDWDSIGKEIGWQPSTAKQHFERYDYARLQSTVATLTAENEGLRKLFDAQVKELNGLYEQLSALRQQSIAWLPPSELKNCEAGTKCAVLYIDSAGNRAIFMGECRASREWGNKYLTDGKEVIGGFSFWCPLSSIPVPE